MNKSQGVLFSTGSTDNFGFEGKRAAKQVRKEQTIGKTDWYVELPCRFSEKSFIVSHNTGGTFWCQFDGRADCSHIKNLKHLLALQKASLITDVVKYLNEVLVVGEARWL